SPLSVPENFMGDDQVNRNQFFSLLEIPVPHALLQTGNTVGITLPDGGGTITTVTLRTFEFSSPITRSEDPATSVPAPAAARAPRLYPAAPSPFRGSTSNPFEHANTAFVEMRIYDVTGRHIRTLTRGERKPGLHQVHWHGRDSEGAEAASGIYFYVLTIDGKREVQRTVLLR
ncbi:MAG: T9SS type A sorting domain-containing protein, partial [Gemmatimonadetes bacterium]|nr:T9SS type A sorting domain-containing protein [Gemmatimonadota bacterium]